MSQDKPRLDDALHLLARFIRAPKETRVQILALDSEHIEELRKTFRVVVAATRELDPPPKT